MSVDDDFKPEDVALVRAVIEVLAEAIESLGSVPSGELYARVSPFLTVQQYDAALSVLIVQGRVRVENHLLIWTNQPRPS